MTIHIAENLKRMRKERGLTQEALADFVGISYQAVSKWERGDGYPDITLLPVIAGFFGVTLDDLVGMNEIHNKEKYDEFNLKAGKLASEGKIGEAIATLREGLKAFPSDYHFMAELACYLDGYGKTKEERQANGEEAIRISERILEFCTDTSIRNDVQANICYAMKRYGDKEKARKMAESLPNYYKTAQQVLPIFLEGRERQECCKSGIQMLAYCFYATVRDMLKDDVYTPEERIALRRKVLSMYELVYEDGNYLFTHTRVADLYEDIAADLMEIGQLDEALEHWSLAADHAIAYDTLPDSAPYTSLLTRDLMYVKANTSTTNEYNYAHFMLRFMQKSDLFAPVREDPRVIAIMEKLKKVAN
ncbi:MAG: helix-turn-helix transcriptional regulator [Clostridia bacterium]|nr:helix-turn-helix transcriptional regulator [Clostridia bacterium]